MMVLVSMASRLNGCAARFQREIPEAVYYHCGSHQVNLTLSKTSNIKEIQLMFNALTSVGLFLSTHQNVKGSLRNL